MKNKLTQWVKAYFAFVLIICSACQKEEITSRPFPRIETKDVTGINEKGAVFNGKIIYKGDFKIKEYGFVWNERGKPSLIDSEFVLIHKDISDKEYHKQIKTTLKNNKKYYVRAFIKTSEHTVYGQEVSFQSKGSLPPVLIDFSPKSAKLSDTLTITGKGFSYVPSSNHIRFDNHEATVVFSNDSIIKVIVPISLDIENCKIQLSIVNNKVEFEKNFLLKQLKLTDIHPKTGTANDTITIFGENIGYNIKFGQIYFNAIKTKILESNANSIKVTVPSQLIQKVGVPQTESCLIQVVLYGKKYPVKELFIFNYNGN